MVSNEKFTQEAEAMKQYVGRDCMVVRKNSLEWEKAVIIGIMSDKRSNCNMYRCECVSDKTVVNKKHGAPLLKILDTVSTVREIKSRTISADSMSKEAIIKEIALLEAKIELLKLKLSAL